LTVAALALAALAIVVVLLSGGGGERSGERPHQTAGRRAAPQASSKTVAGADVTPQSTKKVAGAHDRPVPILMYHVTKAPPAGTPFPELWVSPADFSGQMRWLADNGYSGITMTQLFRYWDDGYELPAKPVVISFDDGYPSHDRVARPVLASHHWPGVLFLELNNVNNPDSGLTASMVRRLTAAGWELGSHTISHPDLTTVSGAALEREVAGSRRRIAAKFGVPVDFFCYPAGKYDDAAVAAVRDAGYTGAVTVEEGVATPVRPFELARIRIDGTDGVPGFAAKMRSAGQ
jgi:peptidoglycan/xylan/chitin deacetylase (PgdA/CDA1 family)